MKTLEGHKHVNNNKNQSTVCDGKLLSLNAPNNMHSCEKHECCGKALKPGDVIRFKLAVVEDISGKPLETAKDITIKDGTEQLCTVGFLGKEVVALTSSQMLKYIDKFAQVLEIWL